MTINGLARRWEGPRSASRVDHGVLDMTVRFTEGSVARESGPRPTLAKIQPASPYCNLVGCRPEAFEAQQGATTVAGRGCNSSAMNTTQSTYLRCSGQGHPFRYRGKGGSERHCSKLSMWLCACGGGGRACVHANGRSIKRYDDERTLCYN